MSYSIAVIGQAKAAKVRLAEEFATAKASLAPGSHEHAAAALTEEIVNGQINFLLEGTTEPIVRVEASGTAYTTHTGEHGTSAHLTFVTLFQAIAPLSA